MEIRRNGKTLEIDGCRLVYKNFTGRGDRYNREGDRNFAIIIPDQGLADFLIDQGVNVTIKAPREEGDRPFMTIKVKIGNKFPPTIFIRSGNSTLRYEEFIDLDRIDNMSIESCDLDLYMSEWARGDESGTTLYLNEGLFRQRSSRFEDMMAESEWPME